MKFKFYIVDKNKKIIAPSDGYFTHFSSLPKLFTFNDATKSSCFSPTILKRLSSARSETVIIINKLCKWSGQCGGPTYLAVKALDNCIIDNVSALETEICDLEASIIDINNQIKQIAPELVSTRDDKIKTLSKVKADLNKLKKSLFFN